MVVILVTGLLVGCSSATSVDNSSEIKEICNLFVQAEDFTTSDEAMADAALKLDTQARLLFQKDPQFAELKNASFEYYKEFQKVIEAKVQGKTGIIGTVSPEYVSASAFLDAFCNAS